MPLSQVLGPYATLGAAVPAALDELRRRIGLDAWIVARVEGDELVVVAAVGGPVEGERLRPGRPLPLDAATIVEGAPVALAPADGGAGLAGRTLVAVPLADAHDDPVAMLVGIGAEPALHGAALERPLLEFVARLVATCLEHELAASRESRRADRAMLDALLDPLTGVLNRRAWDQLLDEEEFRCATTGAAAAVIAIDLDDLKLVNDAHGHAAGDELLVLAARTLARAVRGGDAVARLGGDEFAVLAVECEGEAAKQLAQRLIEALGGEGIRASHGVASRFGEGSLARAWVAADEAMYRDKRERKRPAAA
ncbi:MAG: GGDEF domain-containing protein [Thermoleophilia bacterium]